MALLYGRKEGKREERREQLMLGVAVFPTGTVHE
jgi:hypothetical protein